MVFKKWLDTYRNWLLKRTGGDRDKAGRLEKRIWILSAAAAALLALIIVLIVFIARGGGGEPIETEVPMPTETAAPTPTPTPSPTPEPTPEPFDGDLNPLTGLPLPEGAEPGRRPTAIMLNNLRKALPMSGNADADIIYEILAEGGITRMLGVYYAPDELEKIGTVRSARTYYLEAALGHDAIFVHAGGSYIVYDEIKAWGLQTLDYVRGGSYAAGMAWRDEVRRKNVGMEHSVYTSGERLLATYEKTSIRTALREAYQLGWRFEEDAAPAAGEAGAPPFRAEKVSVPFVRGKSTIFTYDEATRLYTVDQYGEPFLDEQKDEPVRVSNVLSLNTDVAPVPGDREGRLNIRMTGEGTGWWAAGGHAVPIRWSKASRDDPFVFTLNDGTPLILAAGKSYICVVGATNTPEFE